jgi:iron-sulfur cluster assembly accessory protein
MTSDVLYLTPKAAQKIAETHGVLRVQVKGGGCSGMRYVFTIEPKASEKDVLFIQHNSSVITDPLSLHFIGGSTIDYQEEMMASHFVIINPKASNSCGCGDSFSL